MAEDSHAYAIVDSCPFFSFEWLKYQSLSDDFWSLGGSRSARLHLSAIYTIEFLNVC